MDEVLPVCLCLVGVGNGESGDSDVEAGRVPDVTGEHQRISRASVATGEDLPADSGILQQSGGLQFTEVDGGLVVVQLTDEVVSALDAGPAQEGVRLELHGTLAFDDPLSFVQGRR